ncbi:MAG: hypothetical protein ACT4OU_04350 [Hyphomicrobium sp.]
MMIKAHHGAGVEARPAPDAVTQFVSMAQEACFERGAAPESLRLWAADQHWNAVGSNELAKHATQHSIMVGGWTVETTYGAIAVMQSALQPPLKGYVCSATAKLTSQTQHDAAKALVAKTFGVEIAEEIDTPDQHTDRYWIGRGAQPPVKASLINDRLRGTITLRMIHGSIRPLGT